MSAAIHDSIRITESVQQVRGESFSNRLRKWIGDSTLSELLPQGATVNFHNTEHCSLMALIPFAGTDRVPTKTDRAQVVFDWSKTGISSDERLCSSSNLPDRGSNTFAGFSFGRESLAVWFEKIQAALPDAITSAKFFHGMREEYRVAYLGSVVQDLFRKHEKEIKEREVYVLGNGYPERVCGSSTSLISVAPTDLDCVTQARLLIHSLGGKLIEKTEVIGGGLLVSLGMTNLYILKEETFRSLRFNPSRYMRPSLQITGMRYLGNDFGIQLSV